MSKQFVFLGGTCAGPDYRKVLIPKLKVEYFNPVVENWTPADADKENEAKETAFVNLFVLTPAAVGSYSVAELVEVAITSNRPVLFAFVTLNDQAWSEHQQKSNVQIARLLAKHKAIQCEDLDHVATIINSFLGPRG